MQFILANVNGSLYGLVEHRVYFCSFSVLPLALKKTVALPLMPTTMPILQRHQKGLFKQNEAHIWPIMHNMVPPYQYTLKVLNGNYWESVTLYNIVQQPAPFQLFPFNTCTIVVTIS